MDLLETLCTELQISHQQLSQLLLTERSVVSKSIRGHRSLPTAVTVQLLECWKAWQQVGPVTAPAALTEAERKRWERELRKTNHRLDGLQLRMETAEQQVQALQKRRQFLEIFAANPSLDELQTGWAEVLKRKTDRKLQRIGGFALGKMQMQEALLSKKLEMITQMLGRV